MKVKVENLEKNLVKLEIELDQEKFKEGLQKAFRKNASRFNIPGFRKGKAPQHIVERYYGAEILFEDAVNILCPEAYTEAIDKEGIVPVAQPEIDIVQIEKGKEFIFTAKVATKPEVELGEYKGVKVSAEKIDIKDEAVDAEIEKEREKNARIVSVEDRAVKDGDIATIDFEGFIDGVAFEGGKGTDFDLTIGSKSFIDTFEDQIIGANKGDSLDVNVTFPQDYGKDDLAGKPALFKVTVKDIKVKELADIDDEFAKDVSEFDTLEEYKKDIKNKLEEKAKKDQEAKIKDDIVRAVVENAKVDVPKPMIETKQDSLLAEFEQNLKYSGIPMDQYLQILGKEKSDIMKDFEERASIEVKMELVLEAISKAENIQPTDEELDAEIESMAKAYNQTAEDFKKILVGNNLDYIKDGIIMRKTVDFLRETAAVTEKKAAAKKASTTTEKKAASTTKKATSATKKTTTTAAKKTTTTAKKTTSTAKKTTTTAAKKTTSTTKKATTTATKKTTSTTKKATTKKTTEE